MDIKYIKILNSDSRIKWHVGYPVNTLIGISGSPRLNIDFEMPLPQALKFISDNINILGDLTMDIYYTYYKGYNYINADELKEMQIKDKLKLIEELC